MPQARRKVVDREVAGPDRRGELAPVEWRGDGGAGASAGGVSCDCGRTAPVAQVVKGDLPSARALRDYGRVLTCPSVVRHRLRQATSRSAVLRPKRWKFSVPNDWIYALLAADGRETATRIDPIEVDRASEHDFVLEVCGAADRETVRHTPARRIWVGIAGSHREILGYARCRCTGNRQS